MHKGNIPAKTNHVERWRLESSAENLFVWSKWDNCEDSKLMFWCDERDFRKLATLYLWTWFVQDVVKAAWWRIFRSN